MDNPWHNAERTQRLKLVIVMRSMILPGSKDDVQLLQILGVKRWLTGKGMALREANEIGRLPYRQRYHFIQQTVWCGQ